MPRKQHVEGEPRRLTDYVDVSQLAEISKKPDDYRNQDLLMTSFELRKGTMGIYAYIEILDPDTNEPTSITSGAQRIVEGLKKLPKDVEYPLVIKFVQYGRIWTFE